MKRYFLLIFSLFTLSHAIAQEESTSDKWQFILAPYMYLPSFNAHIHFESKAPNDYDIRVEVAPQDYLDKIKMAAMIYAQARKGKWFIYTDLFYFKLGAEPGIVASVDFEISNPIPGRDPIPVGLGIDAGTKIRYNSFQSSFGAGYTLVDKRVSAIAFVGARALSMSTDVDWRLKATISVPSNFEFSSEGSESSSITYWHGIIGVRSSLKIVDSGKWLLNAEVDGGMGGSTYTWQASLGISYVTKKLDYRIIYRQIEYNARETSLIENISYSGIAIGIDIKL